MRPVVVLFAAILLAACSSSSKASTGGATTADDRTTTTLSPADAALNERAMHDVAVTSCAPNGAHKVVIRGTAHNTNRRRADYTVQLTIGDRSGKRLYATAAAVDAVAPGAIGRWTAETSAPYRAEMTCKVSSVSVRTKR